MLATAQPETATTQQTRPVRLFVRDDEINRLVTPGRNVTVSDDKYRAGWRWVTFHDQVETIDDRRARYLGDDRPIDMKAFAVAICRAYPTAKGLKYDAEDLRKLLAELKATDADPARIEQVETELLTAFPAGRWRSGQSDNWYVCDALNYGRRAKLLNEWYEHERRKQPGRPKGSGRRSR